MINVLKLVQQRIQTHNLQRTVRIYLTRQILYTPVPLQLRYNGGMANNETSGEILEKVKNIALGMSILANAHEVGEINERKESKENAQPKKDKKKDKKVAGTSSIEVNCVYLSKLIYSSLHVPHSLTIVSRFLTNIGQNIKLISQVFSRVYTVINFRQAARGYHRYFP